MPRGEKAKPRRASVKRAATPAGRKPRAAKPLLLQADCTLRQAAALKSSLLAFKPEPAGAILDGSAVQRIDTAGLQLLVAFAQREARAGRTLAWTSASPVLRDAGERLGLADVLSLPAGAGTSP